MMPVVSTQTQRRSMLYMLSQHPQMSLNSKSSSAWWHTSALSSMACPLWLLPCKNSWKKMPTSPGMPSMRPLSAHQASHHQQHHPQVLEPITACDHTSQCLTGRSWCSTSTKQQTHSFHKQSTHWCRMQICKHREREMLAVVFRVEGFYTYIYGQSFMIKSEHKLLESISRKNIADMPAQLQCMMLHLQGYNFTIHYHPGKEMVIPDMLSWLSPQPGADLPLDIAIYHAHIMPNCKEAFQQAFINDQEMCTLADLIITGWPKDIKEVPHPLCPYWQHRETLTIEDSLVLWGEALVIPLAERERILHQLHQFHQGIMKSQLCHAWKFLLAWHKQGHRRSSLPGWNLHSVPYPECCSAPHTYTHTIMTMADVWHQHLHTGKSGLPGSQWFLLEDDLCLASSTWPEQCQQGRLTAKRYVFRARHPQIPSLWQWPTICEFPVCQLLYILGNNTQNLKSALPRIQQICWGMHQVCQTCTPMSQVQQYQSAACPASTLSYTHWHQPSIPSTAIEPMLTQNNHSGQDPQQRPMNHTSLWADWHTQKPPNHRLTNVAKYLCHCMLVTQLQCMIPSERFGFLLLWYMGYHGTAIKYTPAMVPHTASCRGTFVNAVSRQSTLFQVAQLPHHFSAAQPALPPPAQHMQPTSTAPVTPATQMNQAPAVLAMPAVQKSAPAPTLVTSHATPVQPQRSSHACMAPRCLIQEI